MELYRLDQRINDRGVLVDMELVRNAVWRFLVLPPFAFVGLHGTQKYRISSFPSFIFCSSSPSTLPTSSSDRGRASMVAFRGAAKRLAWGHGDGGGEPFQKGSGRNKTPLLHKLPRQFQIR